MKALLVSSPLLAALACATGVVRPSETHLGAAHERDPSVTLDDLSRGRALYVAKCGSCHALPEPASVAPEDWPHEVEEMRTKQGVALLPEDERDIVRYLDAASRVARR